MTSPQHSKVHQFRKKNRLRSWLFLLDKSMIALEGLTRVGSLLTPSVLELFPNFKTQRSLSVHRGKFSCMGLISQASSAMKEA